MKKVEKWKKAKLHTISKQIHEHFDTITLMNKLFTNIMSWSLLMTLALGSCKRDEARLDQKQTTEQRTHEELEQTVFLGDMNFEIQMPEAFTSSATGSDDEGAKASDFRAIKLNVPSGGYYPKLSFDLPTTTETVNGQQVQVKKEPFYVMLILRNNNPAAPKQYYSARPVKWEIVEQTGRTQPGAIPNVFIRTGVGEAGGGVRFSPLTSSTPTMHYSLFGNYDRVNNTYSLDKNKTENWYLDAISIPGLSLPNGSYDPKVWDATKKHLKFTAILPKRFYQGGESLEYGKDISFPFILKHTDLSGNNAKVGIPLTVSTRDITEIDNYLKEQYGVVWQLYRGTGALGFRFDINQADANGNRIRRGIMTPTGSLYCMQYENRMGQVLNPVLFDDQFWEGANGRNANIEYDFRINGTSYHSTIASHSGYYDLSALPAVGGSLPTWGVEERTSYDDGVEFAEANRVEFDLNTTTGWYYTWLHNIPNPNPDGRTSFYLNLRNKTLVMEMQNFRVFTSRQTTGKKGFEDGKAYYRIARLDGELRPIPLMLMAEDFISFNRYGAVTANPASANSERGSTGGRSTAVDNPKAGALYDYKEVQNFRVPFQLSRWGWDQGEQRYKAIPTTLNWLVPNEAMMRSVFAPDIVGINDKRQDRGRLEWVTGETVSIEGHRYTDMNNVYYRRDTLIDLAPNPVATVWGAKAPDPSKPQQYNESINVYYAFRFIGTPYASAYRYIQVGKWINGGGVGDDPLAQLIDSYSEGSRYVIQSKRISPRVGMKQVNGQWVLDKVAAENHLKKVIATENYWVKAGYIERDWEKEKLNPNVINRVLHVPGFINKNKAVNGGRQFSFWLYYAGDPNPFSAQKTFTISAYTGGSGALSNHRVTPIPTGAGIRDGWKYGILPFLEPRQRQHGQ